MGGMGSGIPMPMLPDSTTNTGMRVRLPMPPGSPIEPKMFATLVILDLFAASDSDNPIKFIFGIIVVVIWIIGAIMSSLKKKSQQPTQQFVQQDWSHLLRDLTAGQNK